MMSTNRILFISPILDDDRPLLHSATSSFSFSATTYDYYQSLLCGQVHGWTGGHGKIRQDIISNKKICVYDYQHRP